MSTDLEWEQWGVRDPYYGVLTDPRFRATVLTAESKQSFFDSGGVHVDYVLGTLRGRIDHTFQPQRVLDFGCGVGRLVIPFARTSEQVIGMDVSPAMLAEARLNCREREIGNVSLVMSDDELSQVEGAFDLVHSCIVLQHIPVQRGRTLFEKLVDKVAAGGCGAIHVTFGWDIHTATFGLPPAPPAPAAPPPADALSVAKAKVRRLLAPFGRQAKVSSPPGTHVAALELQPQPDPEMQMNYYNLSELMFIMQAAGIQRFHSEFTDHGGALGVFLFFQKPPAAPA